MLESDPLLQLIGISRSFPGVRALDDVTFDVRPGEVHALVGENGAGKSTLINIVSGVLQPDSGQLRVQGQNVRIADPSASRALGIATVHQEADVFGALSVAENMAWSYGMPAGRWGVVDWNAVYELAARAVAETGEQIDLLSPAERLSVARRHMIQVATAINQRAAVLILDEPTSSLSASESAWLFGRIRSLRAAGSGVVYISHRQNEIFELADRITVLRDGQNVWHGAASELDGEQLIAHMVGRPGTTREVVQHSATTAPTARTKSTDHRAAPRLRVSKLSDRYGRVKRVSFAIQSAEIVGLYGLIGAGRTELARCLFGLDRIGSGQVELDGRARTIKSAQMATDLGIAFVPEDRLREGLFRGLSIRANTVLTSLGKWCWGPFTSRNRQGQAVQSVVQRLDVRLQSIEQPIGGLSGGNQQKLVLGRCLLTSPRLLLLDEPTRGVDVAAKSELHGSLRELAQQGCGILLISSELPEVIGLSDRVLVMREGEMVAEFDPRSVTPKQIAAAALPDAPQVETTNSTSRPAVQPTSLVNEPAIQPNFSPLRGWRFATTEWTLSAVIVALWVWLALTSEAGAAGSLNLLTNSALWILPGLAAACVIIAGGIDISIGSLIGLSAAVAAIVMKLPGPAAVTVPVAVAAAIATGVAGGILNSSLALLGRVHPIVVTLGTMTIFRGLVIVLMSGKSITGLPPLFTAISIHPTTRFRGIIVISAVVALAVAFWLNRTRSGRRLYAYGCSAQAARLAGIHQGRVWLTAFGVAGALSGLAGVLQLSLSQQMQARLGAGWELQAIAIAVIGGVAITGGRGSVPGVVLGAILLRLVNSALVRWGISEKQVDLVVGGLILAAVLTDVVVQKRHGVRWKGKTHQPQADRAATANSSRQQGGHSE